MKLVPSTHVVTPQGVFAYRAHAPSPSQFPVWPHDVGVACEHSSSGSVPAAIDPHAPSAPEPFFAALHAWQDPLQALSQQTPSTQKPGPPPAAAHSSATVHGAPTDFRAMHWDDAVSQ
jgi:hypothetical protein